VLIWINFAATENRGKKLIWVILPVAATDYRETYMGVPYQAGAPDSSL
jgi:hypothetical protein